MSGPLFDTLTGDLVRADGVLYVKDETGWRLIKLMESKRWWWRLAGYETSLEWGTRDVFGIAARAQLWDAA